VLADHRADDVTDGDHPHHASAVDHWDVPNTLFCKQRWAWLVKFSALHTSRIHWQENSWVTCHQLHCL
jgi:gluconate kinase